MKYFLKGHFFLLTTYFWPQILVTMDFCEVEFNDSVQKNPKYIDFCENSVIVQKIQNILISVKIALSITG